MSIYAVEVQLYGPVYKSSDPRKSPSGARPLCSKTIDARDRAWFSGVSFEHVPRVSFFLASAVVGLQTVKDRADKNVILTCMAKRE
jgi:hypothetical protein